MGISRMRGHKKQPRGQQEKEAGNGMKHKKDYNKPKNRKRTPSYRTLANQDSEKHDKMQATAHHANQGKMVSRISDLERRCPTQNYKNG